MEGAENEVMTPTSHLGIPLYTDATAKIREGWKREGWWAGEEDELHLPVHSGAATGAQNLRVGLMVQCTGPLSTRRNSPGSLYWLAYQNA